jgi:hypothetical protein
MADMTFLLINEFHLAAISSTAPARCLFIVIYARFGVQCTRVNYTINYYNEMKFDIHISRPLLRFEY